MNNTAPSVTAQVNTLRTSTEAVLSELGETASAHPWLPGCIILGRGGSLEDNPAFESGKIYVQDAAARLAVMAAGPLPGQNVLDACAAPGGKSFASAFMMDDNGSIFSCDINGKKLWRIEEGAKRLGINIIRTAEMDARKPAAELINKFDLIIADVPCSGLGVVRKKPEIRYKDRRN
jgi:16S rRNA (cytosine967-C5)-methyltransferase